MVNDTQKAAVGLYKTLGFVIDGHFENFWNHNGEHQDVYSMGKLIETAT